MPLVHFSKAKRHPLANAYEAASRNVTPFARATIAAVRGSVTPEVLDTLARLAAAGATDEQLAAAVPEPDFDALTEAYVRIFEDVAEVEKKRRRIKVRVPTVRVNPRAIAWAREQGGKQIRAIGAQTREAVRAVVARQVARGQRAESMVPDIRRAVGLLPREAAAVANRRSMLLVTGVDPDRVERMSDEYADDLLTARATRIARTETVAAQNRGLLETWEQAAETGALPDTVVRAWVSAPGSENSNRPCEICLEMDGKEAKLGEPFESPTVGQLMSPPAHPSCRCTMVLRRESKA